MDVAVATFVVLPVGLVAALVTSTWLASRRAAASPHEAKRATLLTAALAVAWMGATWILASRGVLARWTMPPPFMLVALTGLAATVVLALGRTGRRLAQLPLWLLVGVQGFRLPLELAMHAMAERGVMPPQMSYSGRNFDIVSGATALLVAGLLLAGRGGRRLVAAWNLLGFLLLANIVGTAVVSTPTFGWFGQERLNTWVTGTPFVWLPTVMVPAALGGHLLVWRALTLRRDAPSGGAPPA
ncbi:hypothetical protein TBR22_A08520 [Luteitalea sp. TBR-22]|uniref:hypothetical protein n=1 Tax=Luteitalea sp. TBR-22 TaxID=2802971 RepID=UPI001AFC5C11|nr:hypothetical protein [Luteitalea sp. TBR-22]BCS31649.1 hypothetical protein TBR22_A08520 [Luteitalea sp. TBR-22]